MRRLCRMEDVTTYPNDFHKAMWGSCELNTTTAEQEKGVNVGPTAFYKTCTPWVWARTMALALCPEDKCEYHARRRVMQHATPTAAATRTAPAPCRPTLAATCSHLHACSLTNARVPRPAAGTTDLRAPYLQCQDVAKYGKVAKDAWDAFRIAAPDLEADWEPPAAAAPRAPAAPASDEVEAPEPWQDVVPSPSGAALGEGAAAVVAGGDAGAEGAVSSSA